MLLGGGWSGVNGIGKSNATSVSKIVITAIVKNEVEDVSHAH
jgi:hypothetical protein